jgi:hypothetical protein
MVLIVLVYLSLLPPKHAMGMVVVCTSAYPRGLQVAGWHWMDNSVKAKGCGHKACEHVLEGISTCRYMQLQSSVVFHSILRWE